MAAPFINVSVLPMYGQMQARITWKVSPGFTDGVFFVAKSPDGINNWNRVARVSGHITEITDPELVYRGRLDEVYYQVALQHKGQIYYSDKISTFGTLSRSEFATVRLIMKREWETLRRFTPVKFYKLRTDGEHCRRCSDPDTEQRIGTARCPVCYGTGFTDGFYPAIETFLHIGVISSKIQDDSREGVGSSDPVTLKARATAYPIMEKNDMFVHVAADKRYLVETIDHGYYNGKAPVYAELQLQLMARNDMRYNFPIESC